MKLFSKIGLIASTALLGLSLVACSDEKNTAKESANEISVGAIAGPETQLVEVAKKVALEKYNLKVKIVTFTDFTMPNTAVADGSIDANAFQHQAYLEEQNKSRGYDLVAVGKTFIYPMGLYSKKLQSLDQVQPNATIAIPNDPSNEARALLLLQSAGLLTLKPGTGVTATPQDILTNPLNLKIKEIDAAQLPRVLGDVDLAAINTVYAIPAGLVPTKNALFTESSDSPYANLIVVQAKEQDEPKIQHFVEAYQSPEVIAEAERLFQGGAVPAWQGATTDKAVNVLNQIKDQATTAAGAAMTAASQAGSAIADAASDATTATKAAVSSAVDTISNSGSSTTTTNASSATVNASDATPATAASSTPAPSTDTTTATDTAQTAASSATAASSTAVDTTANSANTTVDAANNGATPAANTADEPSDATADAADAAEDGDTNVTPATTDTATPDTATEDKAAPVDQAP